MIAYTFECIKSVKQIFTVEAPSVEQAEQLIMNGIVDPLSEEDCDTVEYKLIDTEGADEYD